MLEKLFRSLTRKPASDAPQAQVESAHAAETERPYLKMSDGDLAVVLAEHFSVGRSPSFEFIEQVQHILRERPERKQAFLEDMFDAHRGLSESARAHDPTRIWLMGTDRYLDPASWTARATELEYVPGARHETQPIETKGAFRHSGRFDATVIVSLYKGGEFIGRFLDHICRQTIMDRCEILILDADSPDGEEAVVRAYQRIYDNIVYRRLDYRISVYEAWNLGIAMARGRYITNANVDDVRRADSLELQVAALDRHALVDVVYQDVFYALEPNMAFEDIAAFDFKTNLPLVTANNLFAFNAPHNAPMWRREVHDDVGLFDTSYRSAADWQFWIRCLLAGKRFFKINSAHVGYFHNPQGVSTHAETHGLSEGMRVANAFGRRLIAKNMTSSYAAFAKTIGLDADVNDPSTIDYLCDTPRYDIVQDSLLKLAASAARPFIDESSPSDTPLTLKIVVDGIFFSLARSGIGRVWESVLRLLATRDDVTILLLDRGGTPAIPGVETRLFPSHTFTNTAAESILIEEVCREFGATVFMSTYYTTPITVPSVQLVYDMIPEVMGFELRARAWQEKTLALHFACRLLCISAQTLVDLLRVYPHLDAEPIVVAHCGIDQAIFRPRAAADIDAFRAAHGIEHAYFVLVGSRVQHQGYKNGVLAFEAIKQWNEADVVDLVCVGGEPTIETAWLDGLPASTRVYHLDLTDDALASAYSGSLALIFPSLYEGFGLPVVEAMACGCPVVTTRHGSLGEVAGGAATFVSGHDAIELRDAMVRHLQPDFREERRDSGLEQAGRYRWEDMAAAILATARAAHRSAQSKVYRKFAAEWARLRRIQADVDWRQIRPP